MQRIDLKGKTWHKILNTRHSPFIPKYCQFHAHPFINVYVFLNWGILFKQNCYIGIMNWKFFFLRFVLKKICQPGISNKAYQVILKFCHICKKTSIIEVLIIIWSLKKLCVYCAQKTCANFRLNIIYTQILWKLFVRLNSSWILLLSSIYLPLLVF